MFGDWKSFINSNIYKIVLERISSEELLNQNEDLRNPAPTAESASKKAVDKLKLWLLVVAVSASVAGIGVGFDSALAVDIGVAFSIFSVAGFSVNLFANRVHFGRVNPQNPSIPSNSVAMGRQFAAGINPDPAPAVDAEAPAIDDLRAATPATSISSTSSFRSSSSEQNLPFMRR